MNSKWSPVVLTILLIVLFAPAAVDASPVLPDLLAVKPTKGDFPLFQGGRPASILTDTADHGVVQVVAELFSKDIERVAGIPAPVVHDPAQIASDVILIGTIGSSRLVDKLVSDGIVDAAAVSGRWEAFTLQIIDNPYMKGTRALVIAGSDRRGTSYGVFEVSEQIGVSPWYWWADVPVPRRSEIGIKSGKYVSDDPSVKYRGIFINDEDWGLKPWSTKTFDPTLGDIGPKTYDKVCELLLRLKANTLWPAMHECTGAFNKYHGNKEVAGKYAIIMGSSHCEPLLFNNATEWDKKTMGEWNYATNRDGICKVLNRRVEENGRFENIYTLGIRGIHDHAMEGDFPIEKQIDLVAQAIDDQRKILVQNLGKPITDIPQIFVPYAEVLHLYNNGLKIPDDVTLLWVDDNYGYLRRLSNPIEARRSGGSGVYYHLAYLGNPHEYTWLSTTNPVLVYEEMKKSFDFGADRIWIANVGDIKPAEYNTSFFLDLAWNIKIVDSSNVFGHQVAWYQRAFGAELGEESASLMRDFYRLNFERKPEFMGWGEKFLHVNWRERIEDTDYTFDSYNEAEGRLAEFQALADRAEALRSRVPQSHRSAFYQLVYYPVVGASYMNHKLLLAQKNRRYARLGHSATNDIAKQVKAYHDRVAEITHAYESLEDGKWREMISETQSSGATYAFMPPVENIVIPDRGELGVVVEENPPSVGMNRPYSLPVITSFYDDKYSITLYNTGRQPIEWQATASEDWITVSERSGKLATEQKLVVGVDWKKAPAVENSDGVVSIWTAGRQYRVAVRAFAPQGVSGETLRNRYVERNGYISIPLARYNRKVETKDCRWIEFDGLGQSGSAMGISPNTARTIGHSARSDDFAHLEYDIYTFNSGRIDIYTYLLPTFPVNGFMLHRYAISVDDEHTKTVYVGAPIDSESWRSNVRRNSTIHRSSHYIGKPGKHTLKVFFADPGVVFDKAVIDLGGLKGSYSGPPTTHIK